jgi:hypothetical protein
MRDGAKPQTCPNCQGSGEVRRVQNTILGQFMTATACDRCGGEGVIISDPCPTCRGRGRVAETRKIVVTVPPGVDEQSTLRLTGQGEQIANGVPGNLFVTLKVKPHKVLGRAGKHILFDLPVTVAPQRQPSPCLCRLIASRTGPKRTIVSTRHQAPGTRNSELGPRNSELTPVPRPDALSLRMARRWRKGLPRL